MATDQDFEDILPELWEAHVNEVFNKELYVPSLELVLLKRGFKKTQALIDVSGGYGFPAFELLNRGYIVVYNDGSQAMLSLFTWEVDKRKLPIYDWSLIPQKWQEFKGVNAWESSFGAAICRGNSIPYVVGWGKRNPDLKQARQEIKTSLENFNWVLEEGGVLYIDKHQDVNGEIKEDLGEIDFDGKRVRVKSSVKSNLASKTREWHLKITDTESNQEKKYLSRSYFITEPELKELLLEVGFIDIQKYSLEGDVYEGFTAIKR